MGSKIRSPLKKNETRFGTPTIKGSIHYDEKYINVKGTFHYDMNAIDRKTKFILSESFVENRTLKACYKFLKVIKEWCYAQIMIVYYQQKTLPTKKRKLITFVSDRFKNYETAWRKTLWRITKLEFGVPIACKKYGRKHNNNPIERYNREIERRMASLDVFQSSAGAQAALVLQRMMHNYVNPHTTLKGITPAEAAQLVLPLGENKLLNLIKIARKAEMTIR